MSLHRHAAKRDTNEGALVAEWELLGAHTEAISAKGLTDRLVFHDGRIYPAEVKGAKRGLTKAQVETFTRLYDMGIRVWVPRTREDARRMLEGTLPSWTPAQGKAAGAAKTERKHRPGYSRMRSVAEGCTRPNCATSRLPGRYVCAKHENEPDDVVPPRRKQL